MIRAGYQQQHVVASPNAGPARPDESDISLLVIHNISLPPGQFGGGHVNELFTNQLNPNAHPYFAEIADLKVSAHVLIDREGVVTQFVPFHHRAWHAGVSQFEGRSACNDYSIGIELEGTDTEPYTDQQYACLGAGNPVLDGPIPITNRKAYCGAQRYSPRPQDRPRYCL